MQINIQMKAVYVVELTVGRQAVKKSFSMNTLHNFSVRNQHACCVEQSAPSTALGEI